MPSESPSDVKFEIGHVLFIDIVAYSKLLINEQRDQIQKLKADRPRNGAIPHRESGRETSAPADRRRWRVGFSQQSGSTGSMRDGN